MRLLHLNCKPLIVYNVVSSTTNLYVLVLCILCSSRVTTSSKANRTLSRIWKKIIDSPPNSYLLPVYAEDLAEEFIRAPPPSSKIRSFHGDPRVLQFIDDVADCDNDIA